MTGKTTLRRGLIAVAVVFACGVAVLLSVGIFVGSRVLPCASCHAMKAYAAANDEGQHASVRCGTCHSGVSIAGSLDFRARVVTNMLPSTLFRVDKPRGSMATLSSEPCLGCHSEIMSSAASESGLVIDHDACAEGRSCDSCHGGVGHVDVVRWARMYSMEECVFCHQDSGVADGCDVCHAGKSERERLAVGPWQVTHGSKWRETHGMGSVQYCSTCHPSNYCVDCHGTPLPHPVNWGLKHGEEAQVNRDDCGTCHPGESLCDTCHGLEMPHSDGFLERHSSIAMGVEDEVCTPCHLPYDCIECHENHIHPGGPNMPQAPAASAGGER